MAVTEVRMTLQPAGLAPNDIAEKIKEKFADQVIEVVEFRDHPSFFR